MKLRERLFGRKVWKVVLWHGYSAWAEGRARVRYQLLWPVSTPEHLAEQGYHLTCFSSLEAAESFTGGWNHSVYEGRAWGLIESDSLPPMCGLASVRRGEPRPLRPLRWEDATWPRGTLMAKRIMLTRKVDR